MTSKEFKKTVFGSVATQYGFTQAYGGWYKESEECTAVLALQKSNFGDYFLLRVNIFVQGAWNRTYSPDKELIDMPMGHVDFDYTEKNAEILELDRPMDDNVRISRLNIFFKNDIDPFVTKALSRAGIRAMADSGAIYLDPATEKQLDILDGANE